jgi:hypothetical protein
MVVCGELSEGKQQRKKKKRKRCGPSGPCGKSMKLYVVVRDQISPNITGGNQFAGLITV